MIKDVFPKWINIPAEHAFMLSGSGSFPKID